MPIGRSDDEMPCHAAAAADTDAGECVASGLAWYCDTWYCHIICCCCCVGMSCCSCFIIIADEVAAGRLARGPYPGLHTYCCGICESTPETRQAAIGQTPFELNRNAMQKPRNQKQWCSDE